MPLLGFAGAALALAVPIWLVLAYLSALRRAHDALLFRPGTWWRAVAGGHVLRCLLALGAALWSAGWLCLALVAEPGRTLVGAALIAVLIPVAGSRLARRIDPIITPGQQARFIIRPVIWLATLTALLFSLAFRAAPADFVDTVRESVRYTGSSVILGEMFDLYALTAALGETIREQGTPGLIIALLLDASIWFALASALAVLLVPPGDLSRILAPTTGRPDHAALALAGFTALILTVTFLQTAATLEGRVRIVLDSAPPGEPARPDEDSSTPPIVADPTPGRHIPPLLPSDVRRTVEKERVGELICLPGTIARLDGLETRITEIYAGQEARLAVALHRGFDVMRANVPVFLDWYYSLTAEYLRTLNVLIGNGEDYLRGRIDDHLNAGNPFLTATAEITAITGMADVAADMEAARQEILRDCGSDLPRDDQIVTITAERPSEGLILPPLIDRMEFETRLASAGFAGLAAGVGVAVLAKVGAKVVVSNVFKTAAAALAKVAGSKALTFFGGMGLGAVAGGAGGSVVPGAGTTAGAIVGGIAGGVAVMVGVDFTLIKIEEAVSRASFEAEILSAIAKTEAELFVAMGLPLP